jgi:hypothetical protein
MVRLDILAPIASDPIRNFLVSCDKFSLAREYADSLSSRMCSIAFPTGIRVIIIMIYMIELDVEIGWQDSMANRMSRLDVEIGWRDHTLI